MTEERLLHQASLFLIILCLQHHHLWDKTLGWMSATTSETSPLISDIVPPRKNCGKYWNLNCFQSTLSLFQSSQWSSLSLFQSSSLSGRSPGDASWKWKQSGEKSCSAYRHHRLSFASSSSSPSLSSSSLSSSSSSSHHRFDQHCYF